MKAEIEVNKKIYERSVAYKVAVDDYLEAKIRNRQAGIERASGKMRAIEVFYTRSRFEDLYGAREFIVDHVPGYLYSKITDEESDAGARRRCSIDLIVDGVNVDLALRGVHEGISTGLKYANEARVNWIAYTRDRVVTGDREAHVDLVLVRPGERFNPGDGWTRVKEG